MVRCFPIYAWCRGALIRSFVTPDRNELDNRLPNGFLGDDGDKKEEMRGIFSLDREIQSDIQNFLSQEKMFHRGGRWESRRKRSKKTARSSRSDVHFQQQIRSYSAFLSQRPPQWIYWKGFVRENPWPDLLKLCEKPYFRYQPSFGKEPSFFIPLITSSSPLSP